MVGRGRSDHAEVLIAGLTPSTPPPCIRTAGLTKEYLSASGPVRALDQLDLTIPTGQSVAVLGRSGSGKSTFLNLLCGVERASSGRLEVDGRDLGALSEDALTSLRRDRIGIVYQFFNLLPTLNAQENVAVPLLLQGRSRREALAKAEALLNRVGLEHRLSARTQTLSGGEMQRCAIARALIHQPALVLADEPTGNLDSASAGKVLELLMEMAREFGATVVMVTHSAETAAFAERHLELRDGRLIRDVRPSSC